MTQWIGAPSGGRERGPVALVRAWVAVLVRPRRFFRSAVAPADQAPGLVFAGVVVLIEEGVRFALVADAYPVFQGRALASAALWLAVAVVLVAPAALHLIAALQTLLLVAFVEDRAGVSETVQVLAYATAPCVLAGVPVPAVRVAAAAYGAALLAVGISEVHGVALGKGALLSAIPAALVFGYGFRGFDAVTAVTATVQRNVAFPPV